MKTLSVIMPYFNEDLALPLRALNSITAQVGVDFSRIDVCIAIDNGGNSKGIAKLLKENDFPFAVKFITRKGENSPGLNRQNGVDQTDGDYIMFIDADDTLWGDIALAPVFRDLDNDDPKKPTDLWNYKIQHEGYDADKKLLITQAPHNRTWLHARVVRRELLKQHDIKFSSEIIYNEDVYWVNLVLGLSENIIHREESIYFWRYNPNSITRSNTNYNLHHFDDYIRAMRLSTLLIPKPKHRRDAAQQALFRSFFVLTDPASDTPENSPYIQASNNQLRAMCHDFSGELDFTTPETTKNFVGTLSNSNQILQFNLSFLGWLSQITK
ncbi:MAG: glycosyltransferase [Candidatus Nomurabacteria bacterium]|jgi:glycosyltransferase involved in cell wall biosynthesis|nr:glycosyltransferase [Candidatus Nomurabacteria bacterium]